MVNTSIFKFYKYILYNPNEDWDYIELAKDKNITWDVLEKDPYLLWNLKAMLLYNPNTTLRKVEDILQNRKKLLKNMIIRSNDFRWDLVDIRKKTRWYKVDEHGPIVSHLVINKALKSDEFLAIFVYRYFSRNPNVTWKLVTDNPDKPWDYDWLSENPNITWKIIKKNLDKPWDLSSHLLYNSNSSWGTFNIIPDKTTIDYKELSKKWFITWDIVQSLPDKGWDYDYLSENTNITFNIVIANLDKPWNFTILSANPSITWEIVQCNPEIQWDYNGLSENPNITWEIVEENLEKPWNYGIMSANPNITWDIIQANLDKGWDDRWLSENPNITVDIVKSNPEINWNYQSLTSVLLKQT